MKGRVKFVDYNNSCEPSSSTFPSCLLIFEEEDIFNALLVRMCDNRTGRVIE
jgi:hypothetical protein